MKYIRIVGVVLLCITLLCTVSCSTEQGLDDGSQNQNTDGMTPADTSDILPPNPPTNLTRTTQDCENTPSFTWNDATDNESGVGSYFVRLDDHDWIDIGNNTVYGIATAVSDGSHTFEVKAIDRAGNQGAVAKLSFACDTTPPMISNVSTSGITVTSASILWTTDEPATSQVEYGLDAYYGMASTIGTDLVTSHSVALTVLQPNATYHFRVKSSDSCGHVSASSDCALIMPDTLAPMISEVVVSSISIDRATITWTTDEPSTSRVEYGKTAGYGLASSLSSAVGLSHSVTLTSLESTTIFHFRVMSSDTSGNETTSEDGTFRTLSIGWPMLGHDLGRTGHNPEETTISVTNVESLHSLWTTSVGSSVLISAASVLDGTLYVQSYEGILYSLDASTGSIKWACPTGEVYGSYSTPTVYGGTVFVGSPNGRLYGVDAATGAERWTYWTGGQIQASAIVLDNTVFIGSGDQNLYAIDATTGSLIWAYVPPLAYPYAGQGSSPAFAEGIVYYVVESTSGQPGSSVNAALIAVNGQTGQYVWSHNFSSNGCSSPSVANGIVYVGSNRKLYALDASTGAVKWTYTSGKTSGYGSSPAAIRGDTVYFSAGGTLYAIDTTFGVHLWHADISAYALAPTTANGVVYALTEIGKMVLLDLSTGSIVFELAIDSQSTLAVDDGRLYVCLKTGEVLSMGI